MVQHERDEMVLRDQFGDPVERDDFESDEDQVSILMLGDRDSGKTSLIYTLVNDSFNSNLPARMDDINISAEIAPQNVPLHIVDYSEREQNHQDLENAILNASVICIVYDSSNDEALDRIEYHWIPLIQKCANIKTNNSSDHMPLILVANKIDLVEDVDDNNMIDKVTRILQEYVDIEAHIETSALTQRNVVELFATAQKAVIYPLNPLFDPQIRVLTKKCRNALITIFELCDHDGDGLLNDTEMNLFHLNCFEVPLQPGALEDLKSVIKQSIMGGMQNNSITQAGFLFIHSLTIDKGRHEFTWQVLKKFNYDCRLNTKQNNKAKANQQLVVNSSLRESLSHSSPTNSDRKNLMSSSSEYEHESQDVDTECLTKSQLDPSWLTEHGYLIKTGVGLTLATLMSMLALKFFLHNNKSFA